MGRRKAQCQQETPAGGLARVWSGGKPGHGHVEPLCVLIATPDRRRAERLAGMLVAHRLNVSYVRTRADLSTHLAARAWDVLIAENALEDGDAMDELEVLAASRRPRTTMLLSARPSLELSLRALRAGVGDLASTEAPSRELGERVNAALCRAEELRRRSGGGAKKVARLRDLCRELSRSRRGLQREVAELETRLSNFESEMDARLALGTLASEFGTIVRQELDIEGLLRTVLEFLLPRTGPTNAAIFLPGSSGDYSLGAYVNYDVPKDAAEVLLDHLAGTLAPKFEHEDDITILRTRGELVERLGDEADWMDDSTLLVMSCRHKGDCLAVLTLFRDRRTPFPEGLIPTLRTIRDLFADQLGRIIRTHHRHLPKHKWGLLGDGDAGDDDIDLAA